MISFFLYLALVILLQKEIEGLSTGTIKSALESMATDKINNMKIGTLKTFGNKVAELSSLLMVRSDEEVFKKCSLEFVKDIYAIMSPTNFNDDGKIALLWRNIHRYSQNAENRKKWSSLVTSPLNDEFSSLFHTMCMKTVEALLKSKNKSQIIHTEQQKPLSNEEQETLRYVAGYVVFSMRKHYKSLLDSNVPSTREFSGAAVKFLKSIDTKFEKDLESRSYLDFTKKWIEVKNRGGLVQINDNAFIFVRRVENEVRKILTIDFLKTYRGEDLRESIHEHLSKSGLVNSAWMTLTSKIGNEHMRKILKKQFLQKWVDIRARSFVSNYIELVKNMLSKQKETKRKISQKAEPGLRRKLAK